MFSPKILPLLTPLLLVPAFNLQAHCSDASLIGPYAYSGQGFTEVTPEISSAGFVPFAQTGLAVYDGKGHILSGTFTYSTTTANGGILRGTFTGTYAIKDDCSGTATAVLDDGSLFHFDLVVRAPSTYTLINTDAGGFLSVYLGHRIGAAN